MTGRYGAAPAGDGDLVEIEEKDKKKGPTPNETAARILEDRRFVETAGGVLYEYQAEHGHWVERGEPTMLSIVHHAVPWATASYRANVVKAIAAETHDADLQWGRAASHEIAVKNGVIDLETMEIRPHHWADWLDYVVPHDWDPAAECPVWLQALDD